MNTADDLAIGYSLLKTADEAADGDLSYKENHAYAAVTVAVAQAYFLHDIALKLWAIAEIMDTRSVQVTTHEGSRL